MGRRAQSNSARVVIVGGGFGGLAAARSLRGAPVRITLVDRTNHHLFQPLLYQVAIAGLSPADIAAPIRSVLRKQKNVTVLLGEVTGIDNKRKRVILEDGVLEYDYLVLATGGRTSYFGHDDWERFAPGLKSLTDAVEIRRRVLLAFELAERQVDPAARHRLLTFVVVGGGPTGVELAGAIAELARFALARDFRKIEPGSATVMLVEGGPRILPAFSQDLSDSAARQLARIGVEVRLNARVTYIDENGVRLGENWVDASTVVWAAGVKATSLTRSLGVPLDREGRILVEPDLTLPGRPDVFAVGDMTTFVQEGKPLPGISPVAIQMGKWAAYNISRAAGGEALLPFRYRHRGSMATIGRSAAIADLGFIRLTGFMAWLAWLLVHIYFLIGFRNRFVVLFTWAWSYFTYQRGARLITDRAPRSLTP